VRGAKVGFCVIDSDRYFGSAPSFYRGSGCSTDPSVTSNRMGISVGWGDLYSWDLAWQWVDITDMPSGTFILRGMVDPNSSFLEANEGNQCTIAQLSWTADSNIVTFEGQDPVCLNDWNQTEFAADISWAFGAGITVGCHFDMFCPTRPVLREQMASFLARARGLPAASTDYFPDDAGSVHEADINRVAEAGITNGCGNGNYCPAEGVTRAQMASFLARAFALPDATTDYFADDAGSIHEADINKVAQAGITLGCAAGSYCPDSPVTRGQMAAFLHRAMTD
jgi:Lysyl oxidase/S-layer homology domain